MKSKILLISYYWPPSGGGGVPRIVKFAKYLLRNGYEPYIVTYGGNYKNKDYSFLKDVEGVKVFKTHSITEEDSVVSTDQKENRIPSMSYVSRVKDKIKNFIRINFLVPDARIFWYPKAFALCKKLILENEFSCVITTSPPYTVQLVGLKVKSKFNLKWISDFRDPWTENVYYNSGFRFGLSRLINKYLEKKVLKNADIIITVGEKLANLLKTKTNTPVKVITNGFDIEDYQNLEKKTKDEYFYLGYYGSLNEHQIFPAFFEKLKSLETSNKELYNKMKLRLAGNNTAEALNLILQNFPKDKIEFLGYLNHDEFVERISESQVLLQFIHNQKDGEIIVGSKLYEYLCTGNKILCLDPVKSEGGELVRSLETGLLLNPFEDLTEIETFLSNAYQEWNEEKQKGFNYKNFLQFERNQLTKELIKSIESLNV